MNSLSDANGFNNQDAILLSAFSYQTYPFFDKKELILPEAYALSHTIYGMVGVTEKIEECFGFIAESEERIVLAFRGSDSTPNLDSDLDLFQISFPYVENAGKTHRGITRIYESLRSNLIEAILKATPNKALFITGHSLGADLAIMAGLDIAVNTAVKNPYVYTYAAGRPGDPDFIQNYNEHVENSFRIFNVHDLIPTLPAAEYPPPFTEEGLVYEHVSMPFPVDFQLNNVFLNHRINCYFEKLGELDTEYMTDLRIKNPGFCPEAINLQELAISMLKNVTS
ncbi:lipase family protein [Acetobacterium bakii]|uniref:Lipase n=1 Tax=Acetobacterium bakii TaxID=52689 RepID=A0A0L6TZJ2_9FIRM|nr:lipase family protein [Acetobacterium bakii]KNZ41497.1 lipase [Acetobacterium bakii]